MVKTPYYILCVDDDLINHEVIEDYITDAGCDYEVRLVCNGKECLEAVTLRKPDLILLDVMMPVMDGKETCARLKAETKSKDIPIIVLSARSMESDVELMFALGVDSYLTKPFSQKQLIDMMSRYLS